MSPFIMQFLKQSLDFGRVVELNTHVKPEHMEVLLAYQKKHVKVHVREDGGVQRVQHHPGKDRATRIRQFPTVILN